MTDPLASLPYFRNLSAQTRAHLNAACLRTNCDAGEVPYRAGDWGRGLYWLDYGEGELTDGENIERVLPGMSLSAAALIERRRETTTLTITSPSQVCLLPRDSFLSIMSATMQDEPARAALFNWQGVAWGLEDQYFAGQRTGERVFLRLHRHPWAFLRRLWLPAAVMALALGLTSWLPFGWGSGLFLLISVAVSVLLLLYFALEWWNDLLIVSDQRVINIQRIIRGFQTVVTEAALRNIQQVGADYPKRDPLARLLNYGTIELRTTGDAGSIWLPDMQNPRALQSEIMAHCARQEERIRALSEPTTNGQERPWKQELAELLGVDWAAISSLEEECSSEERVYRKHPLVWLAHVWLGALVCLLGILLLAIWPFWQPLNSLGGVGLALAALITIVGGLWAYLMDWDWRHDLLILGEKTVTLLHKRPLWLQSEKDEVLLERVDNITSSSVGFLQTVWNYGEIRLALMGDDRSDVKRFQGVPRPQRVQREISGRRERLLRQKELAVLAEQRDTVSSLLTEMTAKSAPNPPYSPTLPSPLSERATTHIEPDIDGLDDWLPGPPRRPGSIPESG